MAANGETRNPVTHRTPSQVHARPKQEAAYNNSPKQIHDRVERDKARAEMVKEGRARKGDGREVDHKRSIKNGGSNRRDNLRMVSEHVNRSKGAKNV